jgi:hypothetical protein
MKVIEADRLTSAEIRNVVHHFRREGFKPYVDEYFHAYIHPDIEFDLMAEPSIVDIYQLSDTIKTVSGAKPEVWGVKFYRTLDLPEVNDQDYVLITASNTEPDRKYLSVFKAKDKQ